MKLGRKRAVAPRPRMRLACYLDLSSLPVPPPFCDYTPKAAKSLAEIYLNQKLGCCVISCGMHLCGVETGNASGTPWLATDAQVVAQYSAIGGYVPGDEATDQGCNEQDALDYWAAHGFPNGTKLLGSLNVNATNATQIKQAIWLFENLVFGIELPDAWVENEPSESGFVWDVAGPPNPNNGHCVLGVGYNSTGVIISTWGMTGIITWAAVAKYCVPAVGELHTALSPDQLAKGMTKAPSGIDWTAIVADFDALGGKVPVPSPSPSPAPSPAPVVVTLAQVQQWASAGLANHWPKA